MAANLLLKNWWRYKARAIAPDSFDIEAWFDSLAPEAKYLERDLICRMADGINYGNWPWAQVEPQAGLLRMFTE